MERSNKFFSLGKTLAAGAFALAMLPGAALATASYSAGAFVETVILDVQEGLLFEIDIDFDETGSATVGNAVVTDETSIVNIDDVVEQAASVAGSASPASGGSTSFAFAENGLLFTAINPTDAPLDVLFEFVYGAGVATSLTSPADQNVGAIASVLIGTALGGILVDEGFDVVGSADPDPLQDSLLYTLTIAPGSADGVFVEVVAEGVAVSGVPLPATLALLGIGLIGFASRKRLAAA